MEDGKRLKGMLCCWERDLCALENLSLVREKVVDVVIPNDIRNGHWITFGGFWTGKSRLFMHAVRQGIAEGQDMLVVDPKFEKDLFPAMVEAAIKAGRKSEVIYIDAVNPERSTMKINPFAICRKPDEVVELILAAIPPSGEQFFREFAKKVVSAVISLALCDAKKTGRPLYFTISKLNHLLSCNWIKEHYDRYRAAKIRDQELETFWWRLAA